jgi:mannose-6-phosphate isomerase-like protein (cupin superfamily)
MSAPDPALTAYPPPTHPGEYGETTATVRRADAEPELTYRNGGTVSYLATTESTNGRFGLYRWDFGTAVSGPDPHFHRTISETFFILSGNVRVYDGREWLDGRAGDVMFVPAGGIHGFHNESQARASMLLLFAPGAPREEYFETLKRLGEGLATRARCPSPWAVATIASWGSPDSS